MSSSYHHTPRQNGLAERKIRHIIKVCNTIDLQSCFPKKFWFDSFLTAIYMINRIPSKLLQFVAHFGILFNHLPDYFLLKVFGCFCYPYLGAYMQDKQSAKSSKCTFIGYNTNHKGYRCYDNNSKKVTL